MKSILNIKKTDSILNVIRGVLSEAQWDLIDAIAKSDAVITYWLYDFGLKETFDWN